MGRPVKRTVRQKISAAALLLLMQKLLQLQKQKHIPEIGGLSG
jgi:hypothetical protein